jgi:hypothetical protein
MSFQYNPWLSHKNAKFGTTELPVGTVHIVAVCPKCGEEITQKVKYNPASVCWPATHDWTKPQHFDTHCLETRITKLEDLVKKIKSRKAHD